MLGNYPCVNKLWLVLVISRVLSACFISSAIAGNFTAFGPQKYERNDAIPNPAVTSFSVLDPNTTYTLRILNEVAPTIPPPTGPGAGTAATGDRTNGSEIKLNGEVNVVGFLPVTGVHALPNDPAVTGIDTASFDTLITMGHEMWT